MSKVLLWTWALVLLTNSSICNAMQSQKAIFSAVPTNSQSTWSSCNGISPNGGYVAGSCGSEAKPRNAFVYDFKDTIFLNGYDASASAVSNDGTAVGEYRKNGSERGFCWSRGKFQDVGQIGPDSNSFSITGISADGNTIVGQCGREAFVWYRDGGMSALSNWPDQDAVIVPHAVSADGLVMTGESRFDSGVEAFAWTKASGFERLGVIDKGGYGSRAFGISKDGSIVVGESGSRYGREAFVWTKKKGMRGLKDMNKERYVSRALAVSDDGNVVVGIGKFQAEELEAFYYNRLGGIRNLRRMLISDFNLPVQKWRLDSAIAVSGDGKKIVGNGIDPAGKKKGWVVELP